MANETEFALLDVQDRVAQIQAKLLEADPMLPMHLGIIHKTLIQYEELVHLLSDEEVTSLIAGQKRHVGVQLVKEATKTRGTKAMSKHTAEDF